MTTQERLERAATLGDRLADLVRSIAPRYGREAVEAWDLDMAGCQRAGDIPAPAPEDDEEWGS